jgi:gliding motility-associated-like protein
MNIAFSQGLTCSTIQPFCAGNSTLIFPNSNPGTPGASPNAEPGIDYSCSTGFGPSDPNAWPYPAWYFLSIDTAGDLNFTISQSVNIDGSGAQLDVDFVTWGPFNDIGIDCAVDLTNANKVDCSWLPATTEFLTINSAIPGEVYVIMITNYSELPGFIQLQQTNAGGGSTDCSIVNTTHHCEGDITTLDATTNNAVSYEWFQDGSLLPETGPILNNVVAPSAVYTANAYDSFNNVIIDYEFILEFHTVPIAVTANNLLQCDDDNDGFWNFDLSINDAIILDAQGPEQFSVTYYESQANADSGSSALSIPYTNTSNPQTIYARIENNDNTDCYDTISFTIELFETPTAIAANNLLQCDDNNDGIFIFDLSVNDVLILGSQDASQFSITYHDSQANADLGSGALATSHSNTSNPQSIYARIESNDNIDCYDTISFSIEVNVMPIANPADNLLNCDDDNNGFWDFDLSLNNALILGIQNVTQFSVTYYDSQANADSGSNTLSIPYTNTAIAQTIYARIENNDNADCYDTTSFMIELFDSPMANVADDLLPCDDNNDDFYIFDLSVNDALILDTQDATEFSITYHDSQANADSGIGVLNTTFTNTTNPQTIYARIENNYNIDCYETISFTIEVFDSPIIEQASNRLICDDDNDGFWPFNLDQQTTDIIGTQDAALFTVTYHQTQTDADNNTNNLASLYTNQIAYQEEEIFIRIENNDNTNCFVTGSFFIDVFDVPTANSVIDFELCDNANDGDDTNGIVTFDLSTKISEVLGTQSITDFEIKFYYTQADADAALLGTDITMPIQNTSNPQVIVARIENLLNLNCYDTTTFNVIVNPLPVIASLVELKQCDDDTDGFTEFNLTESNELISTNYLNETFTYHIMLVDAESALNAISNETTYVNTDSSAAPDILYVRIENTDGCYRTSQLNLIVSTTQIPTNFQLNYEVCDDTLVDGDDTNGIADFDFSDADAQITSLFPMGQTLTITYYEALNDALEETNAIVDISNHRNEASPFIQTIIVRVDSDVDNACLGLSAHITLTVNPLPVINLEDDYLLCVNKNGTETVNIPILDTGLSYIDYTFEWSLDNTVLVGITGSSHIPVQGGIYSVLVTNNTTGCQNTDATTVNESESPMVTVELISSAFTESQVIEATAIGNGIYEFSLDDGPWQISGVFENVSSGEHVVTARDIKGCGTNSAIIIVIGYPKFFTPNGDGYHDTWNILGITNQPNAKIFIFDRYGKLIKQLSPSGTGWDGTFNGKPLLTSDYWFTVEFIEPKDGSLKLFKSHFTLKR